MGHAEQRLRDPELVALNGVPVNLAGWIARAARPGPAPPVAANGASQCGEDAIIGTLSQRERGKRIHGKPENSTARQAHLPPP